MSGRILSIDLALPIPVYRQIADGLRRMLLEATKRPGEKLPTVRRLAADLGVHHNTVAQAYRVLEDEGWLELVRGRGAVVRRRRQPEADDSARDSFRGRLDALTSEALGQGLTRRWLAAELKRQAAGLKRRKDGKDGRDGRDGG